MEYKINIISNLDRYYPYHFPKLNVIPRKGEYISVKKEVIPFFIGYPTELEVKRITYYETYCNVEVHYSDVQIKSLKLAGKEW